MMTVSPRFVQGVELVEKALAHIDAAAAAGADPAVKGFSRFHGAERTARHAARFNLKAAYYDLSQAASLVHTPVYPSSAARTRNVQSPFTEAVAQMTATAGELYATAGSSNIAKSLKPQGLTHGPMASTGRMLRSHVAQLREMAHLVKSPDVTPASLTEELVGLARKDGFSTADVLRVQMIDILPQGRRPSTLPRYDEVFVGSQAPEAVQGWLRHSYPANAPQSIETARTGAATTWTQLEIPFG